MDNINNKYLDIIKKCRFITKKDQWFIEGSECKLCSGVFQHYKEGSKFNESAAVFSGLTNETYTGYTGDLPRKDEESCPLDEFHIYDEHDNEISELTLEEYIALLRDQRIDVIL